MTLIWGGKVNCNKGMQSFNKASHWINMNRAPVVLQYFAGFSNSAIEAWRKLFSSLHNVNLPDIDDMISKLEIQFWQREREGDSYFVGFNCLSPLNIFCFAIASTSLPGGGRPPTKCGDREGVSVALSSVGFGSRQPPGLCVAADLVKPLLRAKRLFSPIFAEESWSQKKSQRKGLYPMRSKSDGTSAESYASQSMAEE